MSLVEITENFSSGISDTLRNAISALFNYILFPPAPPLL